jgi:hypothetical protein
MTQSTQDMMWIRRQAIDAMAGRPAPATTGSPFSDVRVDLTGRLEDSGGIPAVVVDEIADKLSRDDGSNGPGVALVGGLAGYFDLRAAREFHEKLFRLVWEQVRRRVDLDGPGEDFRIKVNVTSDGVIPLDLYGSRWSFKQMHMDRDALLFSHLYGPVAGFSGGALLLADVRRYLHEHRLGFDDLFEWSDESTPGSKPVLRAEHEAAVLAECGVDVGGLGPDEIVFINNVPGAGVLHGVTPVVVEDLEAFVREYHRCSVKGVRE